MLGISSNDNERDGEVIRVGTRQGYETHSEKRTRVAGNLMYPQDGTDLMGCLFRHGFHDALPLHYSTYSR